MKNQKVLLAGASGYLGKHIALELEKKKYPLKIIIRNGAKVPFNTENMEVIASEVTKPESLIWKWDFTAITWTSPDRGAIAMR